MPRIQYLEFHDQPWFPAGMRRLVTENLRFAEALADPYSVAAPILAEALRSTGERRVVDLCSGSGGPWPYLKPRVEALLGEPITLTLTDLFPHPAALEAFPERDRASVMVHAESVDATAVPAGLAGFRTIFTAFHHFPPAAAQAILADAVAQRQGIAIFELTARRPEHLFAIALTPLMHIPAAPFVRPFSWRRMLWSWLVPVLPLVLLHDGLVSCLRTYTPRELGAMIAALPDNHHAWRSGMVRPKGSPCAAVYLTGVPAA
ncbi:MAG: hypothetical protein WD873_05415 [Candidatus Hydrogenedentales bacterium]